MLLTIDIGNTNITLGLFEQDELVYHWRIKTDHDRMADEYGIMIVGLMRHRRVSFRKIKGVIIASVVPPITRIFIKMIERFFEQSPLVVEAGVKTGIQIRYDSPRDVALTGLWMQPRPISCMVARPAL